MGRFLRSGKVFIIISLALIAIFSWQFFFVNAVDNTLSSAAPDAYPPLPTLPPPPQNRLFKALVPGQVDVNEPPLLWTAANVVVPVKLSERVTEKAVVRLDRPLLASLRNGDEIQFSLPDGRAMSAVVNRVVINPDGDKTFQAQIKTELGDYPFTYTMGIKSGFGFIGLPEGRFTIESSGSYSVIYRNPEQPMPRDPGKKDYVIPVTKP